MWRNSRPAPEAMRLNGRGLPRTRARPPTSGKDIWTRTSCCRCGQAACGHVQDIICAMEEKDISRLPSVRHQDKRRRLTSADIKPAVQCPCRCRSRFMQLRTSAPTGHHAAPDIREGLRLPWRMSSSSCSCAHGDKVEVERVPVPVHAGHGRAAVMEEAVIRSHSPAGSCSTPMQPPSGRTSGCAIRTRPAPVARPPASAPLRETSGSVQDMELPSACASRASLCLTPPLCLTEALRHYPTEAQE